MISFEYGAQITWYLDNWLLEMNDHIAGVWEVSTDTNSILVYKMTNKLKKTKTRVNNASMCSVHARNSSMCLIFMIENGIWYLSF